MTNRTATRETVVGVFQNRDQAQKAIQDLQAAGFNSDDIGILMQNRDDAKSLAGETGTKTGQSAAAGATTGGLLGALGGLLVGLGALAIPGIGPVLAAGPLVAALGPLVGGTATGALIGAGTGAIAGALVGLGIPNDEAQVYEERFNQGRILVTVKSGANRYGEAEQILRRDGAEEIDFGGASGSRTTGQNYAQGSTATQGQSYAQGTTGQSSNYNQGQTGDRMRVPVVEETLDVQKGTQQAGEVAVRKNVVEEQVNVPVQVSHEEVTVTRHATDRPVQAGDQTLQDGQVIRVPVSEEVVNVQKQARVKEEIEIGKQVVTEQRNVSDTVRREEVQVDTQGGVQAQQGGTGRSTGSNLSQESNATYNENVNVETPYRPADGNTYNQ